MDADWDLNAVVRGCTASSSTTTTSKTTPFQQDYTFISNFSQDNTFSARLHLEIRRGNSIEELHDLYKPFYRKFQTELLNISSQSLPISPLSVLGGLQDLSSEQQIMKQLPHQTQIKQNQQSFLLVNGSKAANSQNSRSKRRKNSLKKVCHVAAENLSSDMWSWRKYGQKPIKGSPYPRGYYKCSTSKGCMARKQVERNRSDPGMFIVTYTAEHNHPLPTHRNSLAGSTRQKPAGTPNSDETSSKPSCSSEMSQATSLDKLESSSREDDLAHAQDDDGVDFGGSNMVLDDDFFAGLEDFTGANGECFSDHFPMSLPLPWVENSATIGARSC